MDSSLVFSFGGAVESTAAAVVLTDLGGAVESTDEIRSDVVLGNVRGGAKITQLE